MRVTSLTAQILNIPLIAPFRVARRTAFEAKNVLVRLQTDNGICGLGAACPVEYVTSETQESVVLAVDELKERVVGRSVARLGPLIQIVSEVLVSSPSARAGVEMAIYDAWARHWGIPLWHYFGATLQNIVTDVTIPIVDPGESAVLAKEAAAKGFDHLKIKVGAAGEWDADIERLTKIAEAAPRCALRLDANQGYSPDEAVRLIELIGSLSHNVELVEQPVHYQDVEGLRYVRGRSNVPIFADEAAKTPQDALTLIKSDAVDGINIKLMKSGIGGAVQIASICRATNTKLMIGCMLELQLGLTASATIAAGTGAFAHVDLDCHMLVAADSRFAGGIRAQAGIIEIVSDSAGWGIDYVAGV